MSTFSGTAGTPLRVVERNTVPVVGTALPRENYQYGGSVMLVADMTTQTFRNIGNLTFVQALDVSATPNTDTVSIDIEPA